jgi:hypothetical protein
LWCHPLDLVHDGVDREAGNNSLDDLLDHFCAAALARAHEISKKVHHVLKLAGGLRWFGYW